MERGRGRNRNHAGTLGWAALAFGVVIWDAAAPETLSHAFTRMREGNVGRFVAPAVLGATALHLLDMWPQQIDPFDNSIELLHTVLHHGELQTQALEA